MNPAFGKLLNLLASIVSFSMCLSILMNSAEASERALASPPLHAVLYGALALATVASWGAIHHFANEFLAADKRDSVRRRMD